MQKKQGLLFALVSLPAILIPVVVYLIHLRDLMQKKQGLLFALVSLPAILIPVVVYLLGHMFLTAETKSYDRSLQKIEQGYLENKKSKIVSKVNNMANLISHRQSITKKALHRRIQSRVVDAYKIAHALHYSYQDSLTQADLKKLIINALRSLEWNNGESYIWIIDYAGKLQLGPDYLQAQEGESLLDFQDAEGRYVIQEEIAIAKQQGEGFLWDYFTKPGADMSQQKQLAFIKRLNFFDWYLGSAEFLTTANKLTNDTLLDTINHIGKGGADYFFLLDKDGNLLLNFGRPDIVGKNISQTNDASLHHLYKRLVSESQGKNPRFIAYNWPNPETGRVAKKLSYVKQVPNSQWIIGSGFYPDYDAKLEQAKKQNLLQKHESKMKQITQVLWLAVITALVIAVLFAYTIYRVLLRFYQHQIDEKTHLQTHNLNLEQQVIKANQAVKILKVQSQQAGGLDRVTQLPSRSSILNYLNTEKARSLRFGKPFSLMMFAVDDFAKIEKAFDQKTSNQILNEMVDLVKQQNRLVDYFGCLKESNFLIIFPETTRDFAEKTAQRLATSIKENRFSYGVELSISAVVIESCKETTTADMVSLLDAQLDQLKNQGGDTVTWVDDVGRSNEQ